MEHTEGKWEFNGRDIIVGQGIGQQRICTMIEHRDEYKAEDEANARLIAAAPKLLAACEKAIGLLEKWNAEDCCKTESILKAAIVDATKL